MGEHQQRELVVLRKVVFPEHLPDVLAVLGNDPLLDPYPAPVAADAALTAPDKGIQQQGRVPWVRPVRQLNVERPGRLMVDEISSTTIRAWISS